MSRTKQAGEAASGEPGRQEGAWLVRGRAEGLAWPERGKRVIHIARGIFVSLVRHLEFISQAAGSC